jgi:hypothetical protein
MPETLNYFVARNVNDVKKVRIPGATKPFEEMTIGELLQLRPGSAVEDCYNVEAVTSDVTATSSCHLSDLAVRAGQAAIEREIAAAKIRSGVNINRVIK